MPNENLTRLHKNLSEKWEGFNVPLEQFEKDMQDDEKRLKLHKNLSEKWEGFNISYEQFSSDIGGSNPPKKKETSSQPVAQDGQDSKKVSGENGGQPQGADLDAINEYVEAQQSGFIENMSPEDAIGAYNTAANSYNQIRTKKESDKTGGILSPSSYEQEVDNISRYYKGEEDYAGQTGIPIMGSSGDETVINPSIPKKASTDEMMSNISSKAIVKIDEFLEDKIKPEEYSSMIIEVDGLKVVDKNLAFEKAVSLAKDLGYEKDQPAVELISHAITQRANYELVKPDIEKRVNERFKKKYGMNVSDYVSQQEANNLNQINASKDDFKLKVKDVTNKYTEIATKEFEVSSEPVLVEIQKLNEGYKQSSEQLNQSISSLNDAYKSGQIPYEEYKKQVEAFETQSKELNSLYTESFNKMSEDLADIQNKVNTKYSNAAKKELTIIENAVNKRLEKIYKNTGLTKQELVDYEQMYKDSYSEVMGQREAYKRVVKDMSPAGQVLFESFVSGLGESLKANSYGIGWDYGMKIGNAMTQSSLQPQAEEFKWGDVLDVKKMAESSGNLAGSMAIPLVLTAASALLTKRGIKFMGAPTAGITGTTGALLTTATVSYFAETNDIVSRKRMSVMEETGDIVEANRQADEIAESQALIAPLYALDGLPFISQALDFVKNPALRALTGAATELATETMQEYPQNLFETAVSEGEQWEGGFDRISADSFKQTFIPLLPVAFLGGGGQVVSTIKGDLTNDRLAKIAANKYKTKEFNNGAKSDFFAGIIDSKGYNTAVTVANTLYSSGKITKEELENSLDIIANTKNSMDAAQKINFNRSQASIYTSLKNKKLEIERKIENEQEEGVLISLNKELSEIDAQIKSMAETKTADVVTLQFADNSVQHMTYPEFEAFEQSEAGQKVIKDGVSMLVHGSQKAELTSQLEEKYFGKQDVNTDVSEIEQITGQTPTPENITEIVSALQKEGAITYTDENGNPCAKMGLRNASSGTNWKIVKDFKGQPKHSQGGVDISIGSDGVKMRRGGKEIKAAHGLVIQNTQI
jgi:hypothetical protein